MSNPYKPNNNDFGSNLDNLVNGAVRFGTNIGSEVLSSIADALASVGGNATPGTPDSFAQWRRRIDRKLKNNQQDGYLALAIIGWFFAGCFGIASLVMLILSAVGANILGLTGDEFMVFPILASVFTPITVGFGIMGGIGAGKYKYFTRLRAYLRTARDWVCSVPELARGAMQKSDRVRQDLQKAVTAGHLPTAYLDHDTDMLYLDEELFTPAAVTPEPAAEQAPRTEIEKFRLDGVDFLNYLRSCKGKLDPAADEELAAMQKNCGAILGFVHNHPEQLPRVRRFREYYQPTTRKLLDTAMGLGAADAANAQAIRRDITGILHTLNAAYTKLYDTLLQDVSMDVSTEIDTLEAMLQQDGLTHDFASDFGKQGQ